jgi:hypothetical protein
METKTEIRPSIPPLEYVKRMPRARHRKHMREKNFFFEDCRPMKYMMGKEITKLLAKSLGSLYIPVEKADLYPLSKSWPVNFKKIVFNATKELEIPIIKRILFNSLLRSIIAIMMKKIKISFTSTVFR